MSDLTPDSILAALKAVINPKSGRDVVADGMITGLVIKGGHVSFILDLGTNASGDEEPLRKICEEKIRALPGVLSASVGMTAERAPGAPPPRAAVAPSEAGIGRIKNIIAVASGKGGVGKSTVAVNLALGLAKLGKKTGILDADIYGPSLPRLLGLSGRPDAENKKIVPMEAHGLKAISIGFMMDEEAAVVWRGPMVAGALQQLLADVLWRELDVLVVDMPPGTGDAQLTLAQKVPLAGAVIVSTPQDIALIDARKGIAMFGQVKVPILGLIENMSSFICPHCGERSDIFGHGGARETAEKLGVDFLGEIPLHLSIRELSDAGTPIVLEKPDSAEARAFMRIAEKVSAKLKN